MNLDNKLNKLIREQTVTPRERHTFHPRVINNTNELSPTVKPPYKRKDSNTTYSYIPKRKTGYLTLLLRQKQPLHNYPTQTVNFIEN